MLEFKNVTKKFGSLIAVEDLSFTVDEGEFVFITGPSGAGKSTLLNLILRKYLPDKGEINLEGSNIAKLADSKVPTLRQKIGVIFQDFKVIPERTVRENVEVALAVQKLPQKEWKARVEHVLNLVSLLEKSEFFPSQLSGGELQRVSMARALVVNPKIILADEPTGNLDWDTADKLMELFEKINEEGKTILMATHHRLIVDNMKKRTIELKEGKLVDEKNKNEKKKDKKTKKEEDKK